AGVSLAITQGSTAIHALPLYVSANQINAVMFSTAPLGDVQLTVAYQGRASAPRLVRVVDVNFGAFGAAGGRGPGSIQNFVSQSQQPVNSTVVTARRSQIATLLGTGLGPITSPDNEAPPAGDLPPRVQVFVGGKLARKLYS